MNTVHHAWFESAIKHLKEFQEDAGSVTDLAICLVSAVKAVGFLRDEATRSWDVHAFSSLYTALDDARPSDLTYGMIQAAIDELIFIERRVGEGGLTQAEALDLDMRLLHVHRFPITSVRDLPTAQA